MDSQNSYVGNYRFRVDEDYERQYHTALQQGFGFSLAESLKLAMKYKNLDVKHPEIYEKLNVYTKFLRKKGAKTEQEANEAEKKPQKS